MEKSLTKVSISFITAIKMKLINKVSWIILKSYLSIAIRIPNSFNKCLSCLITNFITPLFKKNYYIAKLNIILCFKKSISTAQQNALVKQSIDFSLLSAKTVYSYLIGKNPLLFDKIDLINKEIFDEVIKKNGKTIIVSAHLGIFPLIPLYLAYKNYKINVIIKLPHNNYMKSFIIHHMQNNNIGILPATPEITCYKKIIESLKNDSSVMFMIDQTPTDKQSYSITKFFSWNTMTYHTTPKLSKELKIPITPIFTSFNPDNTQKPYTIYVHHPIQPSSTDDALSSLNKILEELIVKFPEQWWWFHKRWKNLLEYNPTSYKLATKNPDLFFSSMQEKNYEELF